MIHSSITGRFSDNYFYSQESDTGVLMSIGKRKIPYTCQTTGNTPAKAALSQSAPSILFREQEEGPTCLDEPVTPTRVRCASAAAQPGRAGLPGQQRPAPGAGWVVQATQPETGAPAAAPPLPVLALHPAWCAASAEACSASRWRTTAPDLSCRRLSASMPCIILQSPFLAHCKCTHIKSAYGLVHVSTQHRASMSWGS